MCVRLWSHLTQGQWYAGTSSYWPWGINYMHLFPTPDMPLIWALSPLQPVIKHLAAHHLTPNEKNQSCDHQGGGAGKDREREKANPEILEQNSWDIKTGEALF